MNVALLAAALLIGCLLRGAGLGEPAAEQGRGHPVRESQLAATDPHLDRHFAHLDPVACHPRTAPNLPRLLLVAGLALLILGALAATVPVTVTGIVFATLALGAALTETAARRSPAVVRIHVGRSHRWPGDG